MAWPNQSDVLALYLHVPFCARKCAYCAFYSEAGLSSSDRYVSAVVRELQLVAANLKPRTIFIGGGTPSLLTLRQWELVGEALRELDLTQLSEWTVECNPATVSADKARLLRSLGVNRISLGVQSLDENLLERLGRVHSRDMVFRSYDILRAAGFDNINLDLMFAVPGQTLGQWEATLAEAISMTSEHLACYELIYEEDTPLFADLAAGKIVRNDELACAMYEVLLAVTHAAGLRQYEIANFARGPGEIPARACRHNVNYWRGGEFRGLGPSACELVDGVRTQNIADTDDYCASLERGERPIASSDHLPPRARAGEIAAFGLRMNSGWSLSEFQARTGFDLSKEWQPAVAVLKAKGWASLAPDRFALTPAGMRFADAAALEFL